MIIQQLNKEYLNRKHSSNNKKVLEGNIIINQYINDIIVLFFSATTYICFNNDNCTVFAFTTIGKIQNIMLFLSYKVVLQRLAETTTLYC